MEKNLRRLVEDEILYGRHLEVIESFTQSERQLYESQDFEFTNSGFLVKKKHPNDPDYQWDVISFLQSNPDLQESIQAMLDSGERLLRSIYTDRETFLLWVKFFEHLKEEGLHIGDHVEINEQLGAAATEDAMSYVDSTFSIETVGERGIYYMEEEVDDSDPLGDLIDPYHAHASLPRDKYKTIAFVGFNEEEYEGQKYAGKREDTLLKIEQALNGTSHKSFVAKMRHRMSAMWAEDKEVYAALKSREMDLDEASAAMHLTVKQWRTAFKLADQAWLRASIYDEQYFSEEKKAKRRVASNKLRDHYKVAILSAISTEKVEDLMRYVSGSKKLGTLWKKDYLDVKAIATFQWKTLKSKED